MSGFIVGEDRTHATLFPERLDDYIAEDSGVRVIDVFIDDLDISGLGFTVNGGNPDTVIKQSLRRRRKSHRNKAKKGNNTSGE